MLTDTCHLVHLILGILRILVPTLYIRTTLKFKNSLADFEDFEKSLLSLISDFLKNESESAMLIKVLYIYYIWTPARRVRAYDVYIVTAGHEEIRQRVLTLPKKPGYRNMAR